MAFLQGKLIIESTPTTEEVKLQWVLGYSQYMSAIGNSDKRYNIVSAALLTLNCSLMDSFLLNS